jgi:hypothetical protein
VWGGTRQLVKKNLSVFVRGLIPYIFAAVPLGDYVNRGEQIRFFLREIFLKSTGLYRKLTTNEHPPSREATAGRLMKEEVFQNRIGV